MLEQAFSLSFRPSNAYVPFGPMIQMGGKRSLIPDDLTELQLDQLESLSKAIIDPEFRAHFSDLLWLRRKDVGAARAAIVAYMDAGERVESKKTWLFPMEYYERALRLAALLGKSEPLRQTVIGHIEDRLLNYGYEDKSQFVLKALRLLVEFKQGDAKKFAPLAEATARDAEQQHDFRRAREYFDLSRKLYKLSGHQQKETELLIASAETLIKEAEFLEAAKNFMNAQTLWTEAVSAFRHIPSQRHRVPEIRRRLGEAAKRMMADMKAITTEIDISEPVKAMREAFAGLPLDAAIYNLAAFNSPIDPVELRETTQKGLERSMLQAIISAAYFDAAGRKIGVRPSLMTDDPAERELGMRGLMEQNANVMRGWTGQALLVPALQTIVGEHDISEATLAPLLQGSAFVPAGHESIFLRGLTFGFQRDFSVALHLLVPQIENSLRAILHADGAITTNIDDAGIEEVWTLGKLLSEHRLTEVLGADVVFDLRSLLINEPGQNIRNLLAHGLITEKALSSANGLYLWWLILRLVVIPTPGFKAFQDIQASGSE